MRVGKDERSVELSRAFELRLGTEARFRRIDMGRDPIGGSSSEVGPRIRCGDFEAKRGLPEPSLAAPSSKALVSARGGDTAETWWEEGGFASSDGARCLRTRFASAELSSWTPLKKEGRRGGNVGAKAVRFLGCSTTDIHSSRIGYSCS